MCEFCSAHSDSQGKDLRNEMMANAMKRMMGGIGSGSGMACGCGAEENKEGDAFTPQVMMMMEIMPNKLERILPAIPKEQRSDFVLRMLSILMIEGCEGMSDKEKEELVKKACGMRPNRRRQMKSNKGKRKASDISITYCVE